MSLRGSTLIEGYWYHVEETIGRLVGWTADEDEYGYNVYSYFRMDGEYGQYLGPDGDGVEPLFDLEGEG